MTNKIINGKDYTQVETREDPDFACAFFQELQNKIEEDEFLVSYNNDEPYEDKKKNFKINNPFNENNKEKEMVMGNLVGVCRLADFDYEDNKYDVTLKISTRFGDKKHYFLMYMLEQAVPGLKFLDNKVFEDLENIFRFLYIHIFKKQLLETWHLGVYRTYQRFEKNDDRLKGSIDIIKHIRFNGDKFNGKIAYSYRELTADNYFNYLLLYTYERLRKDFPQMAKEVLEKDHSFRDIISCIRMKAPSYRNYLVSKVMNKMKTPIHHPYYYPYEKLRKTCLKILRYCGLSFLGDKGEEVQGILFYVPDLWENFVGKVLNDCVSEKNVTLSQQEKNLFFPIGLNLAESKQEDQRLNEGMRWEARPDYVFRAESNKAFLVLDAKYKTGWDEKQPMQKYLSEDVDKCIRDMTVVNAHATGVIYPAKGDNSVTKYWTSKENHTDMFYKIGIGIPDESKTESYEEWKKKWEISKKALQSILEKEIIKS